MVRRRNQIGTERRKLSLDPQTNRVLVEMAARGIYGKGPTEVASYVIRTWLRENREELKEFGISLVGGTRRRADRG